MVTPICPATEQANGCGCNPHEQGALPWPDSNLVLKASVFPGRELDQQSNGLLSREVRVRVPGGPPFPDRITAVQPLLKRRVLVRLQLREPICGA